MKRLVDRFRDVLPWWLSERLASGNTLAFRFLWALVAPLDASLDVAVQGVQAAWPGYGTPTALAMIGRSRGMIRGQDESVTDYARRLVRWLDRWRRAASQEAIARALHDYCRGRPKVRCINRAGRVVTVETDGTVSVTDVAWNWDGLSDPQNVTHWSDLWIVVYTPPWAISGPRVDSADAAPSLRQTGLGHLAPREDVDAVVGELAQWKGAHSRIACVVWTYDGSLFDPAVPASFPDGHWGHYGKDDGTGSRIAARSLTCRYWEPA